MIDCEQRWALALTALDLLKADASLKGLIVGSAHGPVQLAYADCISRRFSTTKIPTSASSDRLLGALDISSTLAKGKPVYQSGLLDQQTGALIINGAERLDTTTCSILSAHLDNPDAPETVMLIMDESTTEEPGLASSSIAERLALLIELPAMPLATLQALVNSVDSPLVEESQNAGQQDANGLAAHSGKSQDASQQSAKPQDAKSREATALEAQKIDANQVEFPDELLMQLTLLAQRLGVESMRSLLFAVRVARVHAAMRSRHTVTIEDAGVAAQLVLSPRALGVEPQQNPSEEESTEESPDEPLEDHIEDQQEQENTPPADAQDPNELAQEEQQPESLEDMGEQLLEAAAATLPEHLIANLVRGQRNNQTSGRDAGATSKGTSGRPVGVKRPRGGLSGQRLNVIETLKAAAPKQRLRGNDLTNNSPNTRRLQVRLEDFRITRYKQPTRTTTVFVVDASGSAALHRLAEAKGAVELLLAECYVRRDRVAMISFRGDSAQLELPPTRSLVRAKRELAQLPGGGGTPLASGLDLAFQVVHQLKQAGETPVVIIMTDGKANIARDGSASRTQAMEDAHHAARQLANSDARILFVDTAPRARPQARELASILQARYLPLPAFDAQAVPELTGT